MSSHKLMSDDPVSFDWILFFFFDPTQVSLFSRKVGSLVEEVDLIP